jgi:hypothetical protein
VAERREKR